MRFSDMMGSGAEGNRKPPAPSDADEAAANAESTEPGAPELSGPRGGVAPLTGVARRAPEPVAAPDTAPVRVADLAPFSDDLLPRRR